jgi:glycosyltransferase involved in cell wall biosynthesis
MHYGCPVVASNASCFPEIGGDAVLYFEPYSADDLMQKILMVLDNSTVSDNLIRKGFEREKNFSWQKCADETYEFYKYIFDR